MDSAQQTSRSNDPVSASAETESGRAATANLVDHFFRHEYAQLVATLTRRFGVRHWELVEDVVQSALQRALSHWSHNGLPNKPKAWLHRVAVNLAIDRLRRDTRWNRLDESTESQLRETSQRVDPEELQDDLLRMIFVCCHPDVPTESQIALALKTLCGFSNREIARALLTTEASAAKRITRAKQRLRETGVEPEKLRQEEIDERLPFVQSVIYLMFNEGYSSTVSDRLIRDDLCEEAVRLALLLAEHPSTAGGPPASMLALLLFHASRLEARIDEHGAILLLKEQDRSKWDRNLLAAAFRWLKVASEYPVVTRYHLEAFIAAEHCRANSVEETDWQTIVKAYDCLCKVAPSPVHELNRAIAIGHFSGPELGMAKLNQIESKRLRQDYYLWHAAKADLAKQLGQMESARDSLRKALEMAPTNAEKELISRKLDALE